MKPMDKLEGITKETTLSFKDLSFFSFHQALSQFQNKLINTKLFCEIKQWW